MCCLNLSIILLSIFQTEGFIMNTVLSVSGEFINILNAITPNALVLISLATVILALVVLLKKL